MITTIDRAGRVVIPKQLRAMFGIEAGEVSITADGSGLRIEVPAVELVEEDGLLLLPPEVKLPSGDELRELRLADQR
jgi:AbrB family looped-hinge helix DNA binding protein